MHPHRLYHELAALWPLLSPPEQYAAEAATVRRLLEGHLPAAPLGQRRTLVELGAGGGHTIHHLRDAFECVAVDSSDAMLAHCRSLNPDVETIVGDMRTLRLGRTFDAVLIHDAIDYMLSEADVRAAIDTAAAHLAPGGVALVAPTYTRETFEDHQTEHDQQDNGDRTLTYLSYIHDPDPADTTFELILVYLIHDAGGDDAGGGGGGGQVRIEHDRHTCGLFDEATWLRLMHEAGFAVELHERDEEPADEPGEPGAPGEPDWPLYVAVKR